MLRDSSVIESPKGARFLLDKYPLVHYISHATDPGVEGVKWMTEVIEELLNESDGGIKLIIDNSTRLETLSAKTRFEITKRFTLLDDLIKLKVDRMAFVTGNYLSKVVLSTLMLLKRPQVDHQVFDTTAEALAWVHKV
jgi:hypothetical protein